MNAALDPAPNHPASQLLGSRAGPELPGKRRLAADYVPDATAIICGRGKACTASPGNTRLKEIVTEHIEQYSRANNKTDKTKTVNSILNAVQGRNKLQGMFVRKHDDEWWEVEDTIAREKVGCMIRDILHTQYRSSSKAKFEKKKRRKSHLTVAHAKAIYDAADYRAPRGVGMGSLASPMIPSLISGGLFTLTSNSNVPSRNNMLSLPPENVPPRQRGSSPQGTTNTQDCQTKDPRDSTMTERDRRAPAFKTSSAESVHHLQHTSARLNPRYETLAQGDVDMTATLSSAVFPEKDDSSPDSISWGLGKSRGFLQLAQAVIGSNSASNLHAEEGLPDDLSGIFDD